MPSTSTIRCASTSSLTGSTLSTLRSIVHSLRGWPTPLGATIKHAKEQLRGLPNPLTYGLLRYLNTDVDLAGPDPSLLAAAYAGLEAS